MNKKLISIVVPVFNEEKNVDRFFQLTSSTLDKVNDKYDFEFIFTDNHSTDETFDKLVTLSKQDSRIRIFRFSRNFGYQKSILTGYLKARGAAAVQLDCDLQDPPELVLEFIQHWESGYKVVYGIRSSREESWMMGILRKFFYRLIDTLSEVKLPYDAGDFRLIDRCVLEELNKMEDSRPYIRGAIAAIGFKQKGITYDRKKREKGESKFSFGDLIRLALDGIVNHSIVPLRFATLIGLVVSCFTFVLMLGYLTVKLFWGKSWPQGFATITIIILVSLSLNALFLGIIGEYLGRIYHQVKKTPNTVIEEEIDKPSVNSLM